MSVMATRRRTLGPALTLQHVGLLHDALWMEGQCRQESNGEKDFVLQSAFMQAYRSAIRTTRPIPDIRTRRETLDWLRSDLERLRPVTNLDTLNTSLSEFKRQIKILGPQLGLTGAESASGAKLVGRGGRRDWMSS